MEWVRAQAVGQADGSHGSPRRRLWGENCGALWLWLSPNVRHSQVHRTPHSGAFVTEGMNNLQGKRVPGEESETLAIRSEGTTMLGELIDIPTDTLLDMVFILLAGGRALTSCEVAELEKIQRELQRRGEIERWDC